MPLSLFISSSQMPWSEYLSHLSLILTFYHFSSAGWAMFVLGADVVLPPVWAPQRPVGGPSCRLGQGGARSGAVRDFAAAGAEIRQSSSFIWKTFANQVLNHASCWLLTRWNKNLLQFSLTRCISLKLHNCTFNLFPFQNSFVNVCKSFNSHEDYSKTCLVTLGFFFFKHLLFKVRSNLSLTASKLTW